MTTSRQRRVDEVSPLEEIERAVQARANAINLDMADTDARARLRSLIEDEVAQWSTDHKRGMRTFDLADPATVIERAWRNLVEYGPLAPLLEDPDVWEIMVNAPDEGCGLAGITEQAARRYL